VDVKYEGRIFVCDHGNNNLTAISGYIKLYFRQKNHVAQEKLDSSSPRAVIRCLRCSTCNELFCRADESVLALDIVKA